MKQAGQTSPYDFTVVVRCLCGKEQLTEAEQFLGAFRIFKPPLAFPLTPRFKIQTGVDQTELKTVRQQAEPMTATPEQFKKLGILGTAFASTDVRRRIGFDQ